MAAIMDLYSRKIVGWAIEKRLTQDLVAKALKMALERRRSGHGLLLHSDQGSPVCQRLLSAPALALRDYLLYEPQGKLLDNAVMESFFHTLKVELVYHCTFDTRSQARRSIFEYIEVFYNRIRIHSAIGYKSPENMKIKEKWLNLVSVPVKKTAHFSGLP